MSHTLWPRSVDRTEIVCEWHFHPREFANPAFDPADAVDFWDDTNRQDWRVSELSQLGHLVARLRAGPVLAARRPALGFRSDRRGASRRTTEA